jgi:hypothetical protein
VARLGSGDDSMFILSSKGRVRKVFGMAEMCLAAVCVLDLCSIVDEDVWSTFQVGNESLF